MSKRAHSFSVRLRIDLASGGSLGPGKVALLEAGRRTPTQQTLTELAQVLGCSMDELTGESASPTMRPPAP